MVVTRGLRLHLPVLALAALCVTACGTQSSSTDTSGGAASGPSNSGPTAPPGTPDCATVWHKGAKLPRVYGGCVQDAVFVKADSLPCSSGQRIIRYADQYYAVPGGTIHAATKPLDNDRHYRAAAYKCRG
jgi:hypothetical protein